MLSFKSLLEAFLYWENKNPDRIFLRQPINGNEITYTFKQAKEEAIKIAAELNSYSLPRGSHVAILSKNCAHWIMSDLAIMMAGYVSIPIYPSLNASGVNQILTHSESKAIIIGKLEDFDSQKAGIPNIKKISVDLYGENEGKLWGDVISYQSIDYSINLPSKDDMHTIIYTSGTTGTPKGVMHTVGNFMESVKVIHSFLPMPKKPRVFSYLPLAHVAERVGIGSYGLLIGAEFSFAESLETFASNLEKCQPHIYFAVPRIWDKFKEKILEKMPQKKLDVLLSIPIVNSIIKRKLKQKLGISSAKYVVSGSAPLSVNLIKWYKKIGINILQVYGMTEDCIISHSNLPNHNKIGTVGQALLGVDIKFSPQGEILIKNKCLMKGYYKAPDITANVFTEDGYLKTGDKGEYDHDGNLTITGRAKDEFKTDKGKYISPSHIELLLSKNTDIGQICVVGTGIPQPIALIIPSELGKMKSKDDLIFSLSQSIKNVNPTLEKHEKIDKVVIMKEEWSMDNGLITPTLKLKRSSIERIHQPYYKQWFDMDDKVIFE